MKFFSKDVIFFSEVSGELGDKSHSVCVGQLQFLKESAQSFNENWIVVDDSLTPSELVREIYNQDISHFIQKNQGHFESDLRKAGDFIEDPDQYFQKDFSLLDSPSLKSVLIDFSKPEDKNRMLNEVAQFLADVRSPQAQEAAFAAIEELYMNAVIDAPKESLRLGLPRRQEACTLFISYNERSLQISCSDPFGSLDIKKLFARLNEVYEKGAGQAIRLDGDGGAGIGCFLLFEKCRSLIFGVKRGVQTKVSCLIPLAVSFREFSKMKKSLHGFEVD